MTIIDNVLKNISLHLIPFIGEKNVKHVTPVTDYHYTSERLSFVFIDFSLI